MDSVTTLSVRDIVCGGCADSIERALHRSEGVRNVTVNVPAKTVTVTHDEGHTPVAALVAAMDDAGFAAEPVGPAPVGP